jgi:hypothetical protein
MKAINYHWISPLGQLNSQIAHDNTGRQLFACGSFIQCVTDVNLHCDTGVAVPEIFHGCRVR